MSATMVNEYVSGYFTKQNESDAVGVVELFTKDAVVYNAAFPPVNGHDGVKAFCENLYARTSSRKFQVLTMVQEGNIAFAEWEVDMAFKKGAEIGPFKLVKGFSVKLRGTNKFELDAETGLIRELRVYHETTTVARLAQQNAA